MTLLLITIIAIITLLPDIYCYFKNRKKWNPVPTSPYSLSDNYHYFSNLNHFHRKILNKLFGHSHYSFSISSASKFQIVGYFINLIPFHIGYILNDRRLGVFFVRLINRIFLGLSIFLFSGFMLQELNIVFEKSILLIIIISYQLFFPGPFGAGFFKSIFVNTFDKKHIFHNSDINGLYRAMFSETTAPLIIFLTYSLLYTNSLGDTNILLGTGIISMIVLYFFYMPCFIHFTCFFVLFLFYNGELIIASLVIFMSLLLVYNYIRVIANSKFEKDKELFLSHTTGKSITINLNNTFYIFSHLLPAILSLYILINNISPIFLLVYSTSCLFIFSYFLTKKHQSLYRIFDRSSNIIFQLISTIAIVAILINFFDLINFAIYLNIALISILTFYFIQLSKFLYKSKATLLISRINSDNKVFAINSSYANGESEIITTDSTHLSHYINIYSDKRVLLSNFSIQPFGYKENLKQFLLNFKHLKYSYRECCDILTENIDIRDWWDNNGGPKKLNSEILRISNIHTLQYFAVNREYNVALKLDGMYSNNGWTDKYKKLLKEIWDSIDLANYKNLQSVKVESS